MEARYERRAGSSPELVLSQVDYLYWFSFTPFSVPYTSRGFDRENNNKKPECVMKVVSSKHYNSQNFLRPACRPNLYFDGTTKVGTMYIYGAQVFEYLLINAMIEKIGLS